MCSTEETGILCIMCIMLTDFDTRGLERGAVHRHVKDVSMGSTLLHLPDDVWQLRPVQPSCRHPRRRIFWRSKIFAVIVINGNSCSY